MLGPSRWDTTLAVSADQDRRGSPAAGLAHALQHLPSLISIHVHSFPFIFIHFHRSPQRSALFFLSARVASLQLGAQVLREVHQRVLLPALRPRQALHRPLRHESTLPQRIGLISQGIQAMAVRLLRSNTASK